MVNVNMSSSQDFEASGAVSHIAEEVHSSLLLTSIHKRENSRDNMDPYGTLGASGANADFYGVTLLQEPVVEEISTPDRGVAFEYHSVTLTRVPGYGFGIAVSGGRDNPHFANGDPAISCSDVLKSGPAEGKLLVNDRILSANGISLENVDYATAVQVLRDSGPTVQLVVKRRVVVQPSPENSTYKVTLSRKKRSDEFGIVLGCKLYIKEVANKIADKGDTINEGDIVLKINNTSTEGMTLKEAKKLIESCKEKLQLVVKRDNSNCASGFHLSSPTMGTPQQQQPFKGSNYLELMDNNRPSYSSQNLYVQPPTRDARGLNRGMEDDKNNLMRMRRGPLAGQEQQQQQMMYDPTPPPPRPPPPNDLPFPDQDVYSPRRQLVFDEMEQMSPPPPQQQQHQTAGSPTVGPPTRRVQSEPRFVRFVKEAGSVGIRLTGGNATGIYVAAVQPNSPAANQGLQPGDKILKVNEVELVNMTREDAVLLLLNLQETITMLVQYKPEEFDSVKQNGDSFYIKVHFNYDQPRKSECSFKRGEIFHVVDTLHNGTVGSWAVYRVTKSGADGEKGVIPNKTHAEEFALRDGSKKEGNEVTKTGSFFRRRKPGGSGRRSKSLNYEEIYSETVLKFPAYEKVVLTSPGFVRPVVLFGPVADIARERLLRDYPEKFSVPSAVGSESADTTGPRPIRLSGIKQIIDQNKHALIDVTPHGVERLIFAQLYPIVLFLKADSKQAIKEIRNGVINNKQQSSLNLLRSPKRRPSTKKLFEDSLKLERQYGHILTASLNLTDSWYRRVRDAIDREQGKMIWAANVKPPGKGSDPLNLLVEDDFFLFPSITSPRYSYAASSPESYEDVEASELKDPVSRAKSNSNPSISAQEDLTGSVQLPNYNAPPPYSIQQNGGFQDVFRITKKQRDYTITPPPHLPQTPQTTNPPTLPKNSKLILTHSPPDSPISNANFSPPQVDRSKKPLGKSATERLFGDSYAYGTTTATAQSIERLSSHDSHNSTPLRNGHGMHENGNYDHGSYRWAQQQQPNGNIDHDVYRFTRSTAQPVDKARESSPSKVNYGPNGSGTPSRSHYKPQPPPKPRPPPKPAAKLYSNYNTAPSNTVPESNYMNGMNGKSPDLSIIDPDNGGFDSGHGSSLDRDRSSRNYNKYMYSSSQMTQSSNQPYYLNVPPPKTQQQHQPTIDLVNREQSAFELYRKPSELCPPPPSQHHQQRVYRSSEKVEKDLFRQEIQKDFSVEGGILRVGFFNGVGEATLHIPPGALPPGIKQKVYIKIGNGGNNDEKPSDSCRGEQLMLTPMIELGPPGLKFLRAVELRIRNKRTGAFQRTLKLKSSHSSFWKEMRMNEEDDGDGEDEQISTVFIDQF